MNGSYLQTTWVFSASVALFIIALHANIKNRFATREAFVALDNAKYWTIVAVMWVSLWYSLVPSDLRAECSVCVFGMLWSLLMVLMHVSESKGDCASHVRSTQRGPLHWDANGLIGLSFSTFALFTHQRTFADERLKGLMFAPVVMCLAGVVAMPHRCPDTHSFLLHRIIYRAAILFGVGCVVTLLLIRACHPKFRDCLPKTSEV